MLVYRNNLYKIRRRRNHYFGRRILLLSTVDNMRIDRRIVLELFEEVEGKAGENLADKENNYRMISRRSYAHFYNLCTELYFSNISNLYVVYRENYLIMLIVYSPFFITHVSPIHENEPLLQTTNMNPLLAIITYM